MNVIFEHVIKNWKSTVSGFLTMFLATGTYFAAVPTATLQQHGVSQNLIFWLTVATGLAKVWLGMIQKDVK